MVVSSAMVTQGSALKRLRFASEQSTGVESAASRLAGVDTCRTRLRRPRPAAPIRRLCHGAAADWPVSGEAWLNTSTNRAALACERKSVPDTEAQTPLEACQVGRRGERRGDGGPLSLGPLPQPVSPEEAAVVVVASVVCNAASDLPRRAHRPRRRRRYVAVRFCTSSIHHCTHKRRLNSKQRFVPFIRHQSAASSVPNDESIAPNARMYKEGQNY